MSAENQTSDLLQTALDVTVAANDLSDRTISDNEVLVDQATDLAERSAELAIEARTSAAVGPFVGTEAEYYARQIDPTRVLPEDPGFLGDQAEYYQRAMLKKARPTR